MYYTKIKKHLKYIYQNQESFKEREVQHMKKIALYIILLIIIAIIIDFLPKPSL